MQTDKCSNKHRQHIDDNWYQFATASAGAPCGATDPGCSLKSNRLHREDKDVMKAASCCFKKNWKKSAVQDSLSARLMAGWLNKGFIDWNQNAHRVFVFSCYKKRTDLLRVRQTDILARDLINKIKIRKEESETNWNRGVERSWCIVSVFNTCCVCVL